MCVQQIHLLLQAHCRIEPRAPFGVRPRFPAQWRNVPGVMQINGKQTDHVPEADVGLGLLTGPGSLRMHIQSQVFPFLIADRADKLPTSYHTLR
jgi:hypothetical protein